MLYEDEELRKELNKPVGKDFYPLSDVPEIQEVFLQQLEEEAAKKAEEAGGANSSNTEVAKLETGMNSVALTEEGRTVATLEERQRNTLPAREQPERSVRLMKEQGMLRKY